MTKAASSHQDAHAEHGVTHYNKILIILMVLALISFLGPKVGIQVVTLMTAFGVAVVKAYLVIKHFMHLTIEKRYVGYFLLVALSLIFVFFGGVSADVLNHRGRNWENVAAQSEVKRALEAGPETHHGHGAHDEGGHQEREGGESAASH